MNERDPTQVSLILAAEKHAEVYEAEQRTIVADIMNAFFAGAKWQAALADRPEPAQPALLQLAELMRGLEIDPRFTMLSPSAFYKMGKAIADQAKLAPFHPAPSEAT